VSYSKPARLVDYIVGRGATFRGRLECPSSILYGISLCPPDISFSRRSNSLPVYLDYRLYCVSSIFLSVYINSGEKSSSSSSIRERGPRPPPETLYRLESRL